MTEDAVFDQILESAEQELWTSFERSKAKRHNVLRGFSREEAVAYFLRSQLPKRFEVSTGEAVDAEGARTGQLDIVIYDQNRTVPLLTEKAGDVLPAECLLAVVEVKSVLTVVELESCAKAAGAISRLRLHGKTLLTPRQQGLDASDGQPRCQYSVLAFDSNLSKDDWADREWDRLVNACQAEEVTPERIDRVLVLNRGMLVPPSKRAKVEADGKGLLRDWFLHLSNFLVREADRRPTFMFQDYARREREPGWKAVGQ